MYLVPPEKKFLREMKISVHTMNKLTAKVSKIFSYSKQKNSAPDEQTHGRGIENNDFAKQNKNPPISGSEDPVIESTKKKQIAASIESTRRMAFRGVFLKNVTYYSMSCSLSDYKKTNNNNNCLLHACNVFCWMAYIQRVEEFSHLRADDRLAEQGVHVFRLRRHGSSVVPQSLSRSLVRFIGQTGDDNYCLFVCFICLFVCLFVCLTDWF